MNRLIFAFAVLGLMATLAGTASAYGSCSNRIGYDPYPTNISSGYGAYGSSIGPYYQSIDYGTNPGCSYGRNSYVQPSPYNRVLFPRLRRFFGRLLPPYGGGY